jgi:hypothetical protein
LEGPALTVAEIFPSRWTDMPKNSRELRAKMSLEALERARVRGDVDAFAARGAGDDAGAFGENPGSESGGGAKPERARICT